MDSFRLGVISLGFLLVNQIYKSLEDQLHYGPDQVWSSLTLNPVNVFMTVLK